MIERLCKSCGTTFPQYSTLVTICGRCAYNRYNKPRKAITKYGRRAQEYSEWRITVAIPYLDEKFGHRCSNCGATDGLEVDHILTRGSRPDLKTELSNIQWLCGKCHHLKTDHIKS